MCWAIIAAWWSRQRVRYATSSASESASGSTRLQLAVRGNGGRLAILVPVAELLAPELLREDLLGALEALGDLGFGRRQHLVVAEALHVADLEAVDEHPVEAGEVVGAPA